MWYLSFIPDSLLHWFVHGVVLLGILLSILGIFAKEIPTIRPYGYIAKIVGIVLFALGIYFEGGYGVEMTWRAKVEEFQAKIAIAEQQSKDANKALDDKLSNNRSMIKDRVNANNKAIEDNRARINADCRVNDIAWMLYNRSLENRVSGSSVTVTGESTGTKASTGR